MAELTKELEQLLDRHSAENDSDTPDFILARYLMDCLTAWNNATQMREEWYGRGPRKASPEVAAALERSAAPDPLR